jgi:hypothetical protein
MKKVMVGVMVGALGMFAWQRLMQAAPAADAVEEIESAEAEDYDVEPTSEQPGSREEGFKCDGRTRCSQMTSCAEAKYFIKHCPGAEMDGEGDGVPCEGHLCRHSR